MSIYTNAIYGMRKSAAGDTKPVTYQNGLLGGVEQLRARLKDLEDAVKNGKMSLADANKQLNQLQEAHSGTREELAKERSAHSATKGKLGEARNTAAEFKKEYDDLNSKQGDLRYLGKQGLNVLKNRALGAWENAKHDAVDIYTRGLPALKERYAANKDLYDNLGFIGGGALGGSALGALLAGRGNRLIGGTLGAIGGGSAGYLAKVLAKKYGYLS